MHNTGVKSQLRKCYRKSYIYKVCLLSSLFTQLHSIIFILRIITLINFRFFSNSNSTVWGDSFLFKKANVRRRGKRGGLLCQHVRTRREEGGGFQKKANFCERNNWMVMNEIPAVTLMSSLNIPWTNKFINGAFHKNITTQAGWKWKY